MTDKQLQAEIAAIKRMAEGHKQMIESMLFNNSALMTTIETLDFISRLHDPEEPEIKKPRLTVLK